MDYKEIKNKGLGELRELLAEKHGELRSLRFKASENQLNKVSEISRVRKEVAQIMTAINNKVKVVVQDENKKTDQ